VLIDPQSEVEGKKYMKPPKGLRMPGKCSHKTHVLMLLKIIYVLKQACSIWNIDIDKILVRRGYQQSKVDPCLYYRKNFLMAIYIDD